MLKNLSVLPVVLFTALMSALPALAQTQQQQPALPPTDYYGPGPWHMWGGGYWGGGWPFWGMFPMMLLFFVLFCFVVFYLGRGCMGGRHHWGSPYHPMGPGWGDPTHSALQILNERFARGEIQKPEYEEKKAAILAGTRR